MAMIIKPPFSTESAQAKVEAVQVAWNSQDLELVGQIYSLDTQWRHRDDIYQGREAIKALQREKWETELHFRLAMTLWCHSDRRISVRFEYEWQHANTGQWYRTYGNEHWEFNSDGLINCRDICANDLRITSDQRNISSNESK